MSERSCEISVIVPVYNSEKYLEACVESLRNQTFRDLEIILVDDGSRDGSGLLCDKLAAEDSRIKVLHCENGGVSVARNRGMEVASGRYFSFVDSDDSLSLNSYELLLKAAKESDAELVYSDYAEKYDGSIVHHHSYPLGENHRQTVENMLAAGPRGGNPWNFLLVSRDLLLKENIFFPNRYSRGEDFWFAFHCFVSAKHISKAASVYVYNCENPSSLTHIQKNQNVKSGQEYLSFIGECLDFLKGREYESIFLPWLYYRILQEKTIWAVSPSTFQLINDVHPEANAYLSSCPFLGRGMRLQLWLIIRKMYLPARIIALALRKKIK